MKSTVLMEGISSPQPLSENASEMTLSSVSIFKSKVEFECDTSFSSTFCEFSSSLENDPSSLSFDMFGSGNFSEMVGSFGFVTEDERVSLNNDAKARLDCRNFSSPNKNAEGNLNLEPIEIASEILNKDDKIMIVEHRMCANFNTKSDDKQAKGGSQSVQSPKENYIHVRARRGRASSHSLAERVRREKISDQMKLLQELVPGCNQITGKTVVLDEIINYVQSLQQQVEFLSMKLANVGPESNLDTEQILLTKNSYISSSKILHTRGEGVDNILAINPRLTTSHTTPRTMFPPQQLSSLYKVSSRSSKHNFLSFYDDIDESIYVQMKR